MPTREASAKKERDTMKSWFKVILVTVLVALMGLTLIGCGGGPGPEATIEGAMKALEAKDADKLGSYFTEDIRGEVVFWAETAFDLFDEIDVSNLEMRVVSQTDGEATVEVEYDYEVTAFGQTNKDHQSNTIDLVKVGGKWLITEPFE